MCSRFIRRYFILIIKIKIKKITISTLQFQNLLKESLIKRFIQNKCKFKPIYTREVGKFQERNINIISKIFDEFEQELNVVITYSLGLQILTEFLNLVELEIQHSTLKE